MTGSTESPPEIIRDLLHPTDTIREEALIKLSRNWDIEFREYLWKAIESEKKKSLQYKMVDLAITKLGHKAMRKMIRYVESGILHPKARTAFLNAYFEYENEEIRIALIKSLKRYNSQTYHFVCKMILSDLITLWDYSKFESYFTDIFDQEIPDDARTEFMGALTSMYRFNRNFRIKIKRGVFDIITEDELLYSCLLDALFKIDPKRFKYARYRNKPVKTVWDNWKWDISGEWFQLNEVILRLNEYDTILLDAVTSKHPGVRNYVIRILGKIGITVPPPDFGDSYYNNLFDIWGDLISEKLETKFLYIEEFTEDRLEEFFYNTDKPILTKLKDFKINHDLLVFILAYLPRKYLISLAENDPDQNNRALAYELLINPDCWENEMLIGPDILWEKVLSLCIRSLRFEQLPDEHEEETTEPTELTEPTIQEIVTRLAIFLLSILEKNESEITTHIQANVDVFQQQLSFASHQLAHIVSYKLEKLEGKTPVIPEGTTITTYLTSEVYNSVFQNLENENTKGTIINLITSNPFEIRNAMVEYLQRLVEEGKIPSSVEEEENILEILDRFENDEDIRIRGKTRLLKTRIQSDSD